MVPGPRASRAQTRAGILDSAYLDGAYRTGSAIPADQLLLLGERFSTQRVRLGPAGWMRVEVDDLQRLLKPPLLALSTPFDPRRCCASEAWLTNFSMEYYVAILCAKYNELRDNHEGLAAILPSIMHNEIWQGQPPPSRYLRRKRAFEQGKTLLMQAQDLRYAFAFINERAQNSHWQLLVIDFEEHRVSFMCPLAHSGEEALAWARNLLDGYYGDANGQLRLWSFLTAKAPRQPDGFNCGVFCCRFVQDILGGQALNWTMSKTQSRAYRREMLELICGEQKYYDVWFRNGLRRAQSRLRRHANAKDAKTVAPLSTAEDARHKRIMCAYARLSGQPPQFGLEGLDLTTN